MRELGFGLGAIRDWLEMPTIVPLANSLKPYFVPFVSFVDHHRYC